MHKPVPSFQNVISSKVLAAGGMQAFIEAMAVFDIADRGQKCAEINVKSFLRSHVL